jgi:hypothetical protein
MRFSVLVVCSFALFVSAAAQTEFRLLATQKTSTTQNEMQEAAEAGFHFAGVMGGQTAFGGKEVVTIMQRNAGDEPRRYSYKLLATQKTSTMQKELQQLGDEGYEYKGQTVFETAFGGKEVVVILELDHNRTDKMRYEYLLLATKKTSTMQKEMSAAGTKGFEFVGVTVGDTAFGGNEVVSILRRKL